MTKETATKLSVSTYPQFFEELLRLRGLNSDEERDIFLNPDYERDTHDPALLKDIQRAADRIWEAVEKKQKVLIYADYDADGVCSAAILSEFFKTMDFPFGVYMPDRTLEGHGLNSEAIQRFIDDKVELLITLDCGITGVDEVDLANKAGIDVLIVDHHQVIESAPAAYAVVNQHQEGDTYPFKGLCGAGLSFKLYCVLSRDGRFGKPAGHEKWLLDLVALATVADMMPMKEENRVFVKYGLFVLAQGKRAGLSELCAVSRISPYFDAKTLETNVNEITLGFVLGPRVNAASRIGHAALAYDLLVARDRRSARAYALELEENNEKRKKEVSFVVSELSARLSAVELPEFIVECSDTWPVPLLGLVAGKTQERTGKPVLLANTSQKSAKASLRAPEGFNLMSALSSISSHLNQFGGHAQAAGCSFEKDKIDAIKKGLLKYAFEHPILDERQKWDVKCSLADITLDNAYLIEKLAPFGQQNLVPKLCIENSIVLDTQIIGKDGNHARIRIADEEGNERTAVFFFHNGDIENIKKGERYSCVGELSVNTWNGNKAPQFKLSHYFS